MISTTFEKEAIVHYQYFLRIAYKMTGNKLDAEDLVQDTYIRAFRFFSTFQPGTNLKAWMFRIMKNLFINFSRKKSKHYSVDLDEVPVQPSTEADEEELLNYDITKIMVGFKDEYRMVILLYLNEFTLAEISNLLKWPLGTVKSRLHRARKEFREALNNTMV